MATGEGLDERSRRAGRAAGVRHHPGISLSDVNRRRTELWSVSLVLVAVVAGAIAFIFLGAEALFDSWGLEPSSWPVGVLIGGLALAFLVYVIEKERSLRGLANLLVEERVHSAALSHRLLEMSRLSEFGRAVNATLDLQSVFDLIVSSAVEVFQADKGAILLTSDDGSQLIVESLKGGATTDVRGEAVAEGSGIAGRVAQDGKPLLVNDAGTTSGAEIFDFETALAVPLVRAGDVTGVLVVGSGQPGRRFTEEDLRALNFFGEHAAIAIANARVFEHERETIVRLEELDQLKSDFVAVVSHELRSPLTAIIGAAKTVAARGHQMTSDQRASFMEMIHRQAERMLRMAEDFLTASSLESGAPRLRRERVELRSVAQRIIADLKESSAGDSSVTLATNPDLPEVWGDSAAVEQVLTNLVENALKYSPSGSSVQVLIEESESEATLQVSDNGRGISSEEIGSIFDRYRQADSRTGASGGVGLGLFIVKNLVNAHRGSIEVESEVGVGTTFRVRLPKRTER